MQLSARLAALAALALAAACSESPMSPEAPAAPEASSETRIEVPESPSYYLSTTSRATAVATCTGPTILLSADEKRTLDLHNLQRAKSLLSALCVDPALTKAARAHSDDMIAKSYFSHTSLTGTTFVTRVTTAGYTPYTALAENIALGSGTSGAPDAIFTNWMNSTGHRTNILNGRLRQVGVGVGFGTWKGYAGVRMYTVDFGSR